MAPEKRKTFDCVEMKLQIQKKLQEEWSHHQPGETRAKIHHWLTTGDDPLARWWQRMLKGENRQTTQNIEDSAK